MSSYVSHHAHRSGKRSDKRDKNPRSSQGSGRQERGPPTLPLSFLFVVNEFNVIEEGNGRSPLADAAGNPLPPIGADGYGTEKQGDVWRYENGIVSSAPGYIWSRPQPGSPGDILAALEGQDELGQPTVFYDPMEPHSTHSVFNCWRFLPCLWTDVDASTVEEMGVEHKWLPLEFEHRPHEHGVTRIPGPERYVAGKNPSWMPSVLPSTYSTPCAAHSSRGLGGPFGIIIGLLALTRRPGHADEAFKDDNWKNGQWSGGRSARAEPDSKGPPRGVMVHICYDKYHNPMGSTFDSLLAFEDRERALTS